MEDIFISSENFTFKINNKPYLVPIFNVKLKNYTNSGLILKIILKSKELFLEHLDY